MSSELSMNYQYIIFFSVGFRIQVPGLGPKTALRGPPPQCTPYRSIPGSAIHVYKPQCTVLFRTNSGF